MNRGTAIIWLVVVAACLFIPSGFDTTAEIGTWAAAEHTPATAPVLDTFRASLAQAVRLSSETLRYPVNAAVAARSEGLVRFTSAPLAGASGRPFILRI